MGSRFESWWVHRSLCQGFSLGTLSFLEFGVGVSVLSDDIRGVREQIDAMVYGTGILPDLPVDIIEIAGADGLDLLHRLSTNNLLRVNEGQAAPTVFTTDKGRIVAYAHLIMLPQRLLLVVSSAFSARLIAWIDKYTIMEDVQVTRSHNLAAVVLLGAKTSEALVRATGHELQPQAVTNMTVAGIPLHLVLMEEFGMFTGILLVSQGSAAPLLEYLLSCKIPAISSRAYTTLRTLKGIPAALHELTESFNPYEVRLTHAISFNKGCYIGQEVIARLDTYAKVQRQMCQVVMSELDDLIKPGTPLIFDGNEIGVMTTVSDVSLEQGYLSIGILKKSAFQADDTIRVSIAGTTIAGVARRFPVI